MQSAVVGPCERCIFALALWITEAAGRASLAPAACCRISRPASELGGEAHDIRAIWSGIGRRRSECGAVPGVGSQAVASEYRDKGSRCIASTSRRLAAASAHDHPRAYPSPSVASIASIDGRINSGISSGPATHSCVRRPSLAKNGETRGAQGSSARPDCRDRWQPESETGSQVTAKAAALRLLIRQ